MLQAFDAIEGDKAVCEYTQQEVTEDPLVVLTCGHVLPMSSMDAYMRLHEAYTTDKEGKWLQACQFVVMPTLCILICCTDALTSHHNGLLSFSVDINALEKALSLHV